MDEATANKILEDYLTGRASEAEFRQALDFLRKRAEFDTGLAALFRDLDLLGGIDHEAAQEIMPYYLEPLARAQLPPDERRRFVAHMSQCPDCATDFLELQGLVGVPVPLLAPTPAPAVTETKPWPHLEPLVQALKNMVRSSIYAIRFEPVTANGVHETGSGYQTGAETNDPTGEYSVLFEDFLDETTETGLQASITAWRTSATRCDLQVELVDPLEQNHQSGQTITLEYTDKRIIQKTGENGETVFLSLEIAMLPSLKIKIEVKS
ncbi:MAG: zf-HC2 domain-containing protein [Chloroflexi bacterium]|nr:zf-HC2 domain-containing protein [Chloroflexota bacterium]OJV95845.1 MAG: hypothetical protein BGO39_21260 [Chloroflexi bacterium 54-19]